MGRKKQKLGYLESARLRRWTPPPRDINGMRFAFSILVTGDTFIRAEDIFLWNDIRPPDMKQYYRAQQLVCEAIINLAEESMNTVSESLPAQTIIGFDGSWEHRRNSNRSFLPLLKLIQGE